MNNNLIIFYHDESRDVYSFPVNKSEEAALEDFRLMRPDVQGEDIKKYFYVTEDETAPDTYGNFFNLSEDLKLTMNMRSYTIDKKDTEIRQKRDAFLKRLDLPFMLSLEDDNEELKNHIKEIKIFLRDLPENLKYDELKDSADIVKYNPFGNIFTIQMVDHGEGYTTPPKVTVDPPKGVMKGFTAEAISFIKDGKVTRIEIIENGCAYDYVPFVNIDPPEEGKQAVALCAPPQNVFISDQDIIENTSKYYEP
jgi:hypothetical protein